MKKYFLLFCVSLFLLSCKKKCIVVEDFMLAESEYTILPFSENKYYIFKDVKEATLSDKELIEIEVLFQKMVTEHNEGQVKWLAKHNKENPKNQWKKTGYELETKGFKRQYLPVINKKGEKEVWINFFCNDPKDVSWKTEIYDSGMADGGNCFYRLKINLATKQVYNLFIDSHSP